MNTQLIIGSVVVKKESGLINTWPNTRLVVTENEDYSPLFNIPP
jgi:hypothetical protein